MNNLETRRDPDRVVTLGAGIIAQSWAVAFARGGFEVVVYKPNGATLGQVQASIRELFRELEQAESISPAHAAESFSRVSTSNNLRQALGGACFVQENLPEDLELKVEVLSAVMRVLPPGTPVASSTSAIQPAELGRDLPGRERCFVAHSLNPPHLIPAVEIVPAPWTSASILARAVEVYEAIGQRPIVLDAGIERFNMSRLQSALLHEAFRLPERGVASPAAIERAVSDVLGLRWSVLGPLESVALNATDGTANYVARFGEIHRRRGADMNWQTD